MFVFKRFNNEDFVDSFKSNIITNSYELKFDIRPRKIGLYSKISKNFINIENVSEIETHGSPIFIHFYGVVLKKKYLLGIICPQILYTLLTFGILFTKDEFLWFKIIALIVWIYVYISDIGSINYIYKKLIDWMK